MTPSPLVGATPSPLVAPSAFAVAHFAQDRDDLEPKPIRPEWVIEGDPQARVLVVTRSTLNLTSGLWDCTAGKFRWVYGSDEIIHIVEGRVILEDRSGATLDLRPGGVAHFVPGDEVIWTVPEYVKKVWVDRYPRKNPVARLRARLALRRAGAAAGTPGF